MADCSCTTGMKKVVDAAGAPEICGGSVFQLSVHLLPEYDDRDAALHIEYTIPSCISQARVWV